MLFVETFDSDDRQQTAAMMANKEYKAITR